MANDLISQLSAWYLDMEVQNVAMVESLIAAIERLSLSPKAQWDLVDDGPELDLYWPWKRAYANLLKVLSPTTAPEILQSFSDLDAAFDLVPEPEWDCRENNPFQSASWGDVRIRAQASHSIVQGDTLSVILRDLRSA